MPGGGGGGGPGPPVIYSCTLILGPFKNASAKELRVTEVAEALKDDAEDLETFQVVGAVSQWQMKRQDSALIIWHHFFSELMIPTNSGRSFTTLSSVMTYVKHATTGKPSGEQD